MSRWGAQWVLLLGLAFGGDALAARGDHATGGPAVEARAAGQSSKGSQNKKGKAGNDKKKAGKKKDGVQETGIKSFDKVFREVGDIDQRLSHAENQLRTGRTNLNAALGLPKGTPFADALTDLQSKAGGKLRLAVGGGGIPKLEPTDAVPRNVQVAVDGFNGFTQNLTSSFADVKDLSKDITGLVDATAKMPNNLVKEFTKSSNGSVNLLEKLFVLPKAVKATTHNIKIVTGLDDRVTSLSNRMTDLVQVVNQSFEPAHPTRGGNGGKGGGKKKKKGGGR